MEPYVYRIKKKDTGEFYYGVKFAKDADPDTFWKNYFTSSKYVHRIIEAQGKDIFETKIVKTFETAQQALTFEHNIIKRTIKSDKSLNFNIGGTCDDHNKVRRVKDPLTGLSSYDISGMKYSEYLKNNPDKLKMRADKLKKTLKDNPEIVKNRTKKIMEGLDVVKPNGKTIRQERSERMLGDKNPAKRSDVRNKISQSVLAWIEKHPEEVQAIRDKSRIAMSTPDENGLTTFDKHSAWMKENNPTTNTIWVNDGTKSMRVRENEIPDGYEVGRIMKKPTRKERTCPHCDKVGKGPNMTRYHFDNCKQKV